MTATKGTEAEQEIHLWERYEITLKFIDEIAAGRPASGDLVERHMELFRHQATNVMKLSFLTEGEVTEDVRAVELWRREADPLGCGRDREERLGLGSI